MPADPVVSPADTSELERAIRRGIWRADTPFPPDYSADEYQAPALVALAALLAVGEQDKAEIAEWKAEVAEATKLYGDLSDERERERQRIAQLTKRLEPLQQRVLAMIERNGFVFRTPLDKPDTERTEAERWEKLAFTLYTEICETDSIVRAVLADKEDAGNG